MAEKKKIRVLVAKVGLDGHDRGVKVVAYALRDAGMEVIYTGLHRTPSEIAHTALQEDVDCIGLSILSGAHLFLCEELRKEMIELGIADLPVILGGVIPERDMDSLKKIGIREIFPGGTAFEDIIKGIERITADRVNGGV
jgi:methylmalonyl-CoA mutase, C-terminal domain